ncbi:hypothetical protein [Spirosoma utsteinense]|uniref:Uncharacterized protein n=1 Tax=Spirosoma utsteinense TaxID=2585773 RepID=A0ABR6WBV7_9BACT|nr:hypothetical protein [Spirosoma utsteinense]MBC3789332.1 hypothetical protein [Spirosoma utsteinense]MBC3794027.1 hypothetical protein [Spirosoma utsteinense]
MGLKVTILLLLVSFVPQRADAQLDWLLKQVEFKPILKAHLKEVKRKGGPPLVSTLTFSYKNDTLAVNLSSISLLSELEKDLPVSFTRIKNQPFLIFDGSEKLIHDKPERFETAKAFVGGNLCDDLTYRKLLAQPGSKEVPVPCGWLYHPSIDRSLFWKGRLVKHKYIPSS